MAALDYFNQEPIVHTWSYKLDRAKSYDSSHEIDVQVPGATGMNHENWNLPLLIHRRLDAKRLD
jgi:hypothetical protein